MTAFAILAAACVARAVQFTGCTRSAPDVRRRLRVRVPAGAVRHGAPLSGIAGARGGRAVHRRQARGVRRGRVDAAFRRGSFEGGHAPPREHRRLVSSGSLGNGFSSAPTMTRGPGRSRPGSREAGAADHRRQRRRERRGGPARDRAPPRRREAARRRRPRVLRRGGLRRGREYAGLPLRVAPLRGEPRRRPPARHDSGRHGR